MHELGIIFYIIDDVKEVAIKNKVNHVNKVVLELGEVSGVVPYYLEDCWKWATNKEDILRGCELKIETIKAITYCEDCNSEYETVAHGKICPNCGSEHTYLKIGNEVNIKEIEV